MSKQAWIALVALCAIAGCSQEQDRTETTAAPHDAAARDMPRTFYAPGLGDMMQALQVRHAKLWFAGEAQHWELVAFEVHEIEETLERIALWHADHDDIPTAAWIDAYMQGGIDAIERSIEQADPAAFTAGFDQLTNGCNDCHRSAEHGFIVIQRPQNDAYGNQRWQKVDG